METLKVIEHLYGMILAFSIITTIANIFIIYSGSFGIINIAHAIAVYMNIRLIHKSYVELKNRE